MTWNRSGRAATVAVVAAMTAVAGLHSPAHAEDGAARQALQTRPGEPGTKSPVAQGIGGAVSTVDADATEAGMDVLRRGGTAVDAAVAAAAALGVTEPFSAGIGGGGYLVHYDADSGKVTTLDGRETAPAAAAEDLLLDSATGEPLPFEEARVSGLSVGTPGTLLTWEEALDRWGRFSLDRLLQPAIALAADGFVVDDTFRSQVAENAEIFADFPASAELYLPSGDLPEIGTVLRNPDLAETYRLIAEGGMDAFYSGPVAEDIVETVQAPPVADGVAREVRAGSLSLADLGDYQVLESEPTVVEYRGLEVYGMAPSSSGGSTVGEALNILENAELSSADAAGALHRYLEASALAFADRNRYVGDPAVVDVPIDELLSQEFADVRSCEFDPDRAAAKPVGPGIVGDGVLGAAGTNAPDGGCAATAAPGEPVAPGGSTTHLTTADRWGNVVSYTLTIEQTGGSGITVPGRGFLLNNELTDFNAAPTQGEAFDPNLPGPGKRPRSSMSPTIVLDDGRPFLALGSPGGATIITTVLQTLVNRVDLEMELLDAVAAPRYSQRNVVITDAEPAALDTPEASALEALGHEFGEVEEIGALTGIEFRPNGRMVAVAEPERRGGGSASVLVPTRR